MATSSFMLWLTMFGQYVAWWLVPIIILFVYKKRLSKYPIDVTIYEKRGENIIKTNDRAGRFEDPISEYKLKMSKDTIPIPQYDWVLQCMHRPTNLFEKMANLLSGTIGSITLFKYSSKQYKPIRVNLNNGTVKTMFKPIINAKGEHVYIQVYELINPVHSLSKLDFEVIDWDDINHMTQELRAIATRRSPILKFLEKYGGFIILAIGFISLVIAGYYYKEVILDAGNKYITMIKPNAVGGINNITNGTTPNIINNLGNLVKPAGT